MPAYYEYQKVQLTKELVQMSQLADGRDSNQLPWPLERRLAALRIEMVLNHGAFRDFAEVCRNARERASGLKDRLLLLLCEVDGLRREPRPDSNSIRRLFSFLREGLQTLPVTLQAALLEKLEFDQAGAIHQDEGEYKLAAKMHELSARKAQQIGLLNEAKAAGLLHLANGLLAIHRDDRLTPQDRETVLTTGLSEMREVYGILQKTFIGEEWENWRYLRAPMQVVLAHFWADMKNPDFDQHYRQLSQPFNHCLGIDWVERRITWGQFFSALKDYYENQPDRTTTLVRKITDDNSCTDSLLRSANWLLLARVKRDQGALDLAIRAYGQLLAIPSHRIHAAQAVAKRELNELVRNAQ